MRKRLGPRGIVGAVVFVLTGVNEAIALAGRGNLLDRILSHAFGWQVTPTFNLLVMAFGLLLILTELRRPANAHSTVTRPEDAKRAQVEPELVYEGPPNHQTATVYCRNIGKSYAREVSIQITGNTLSPLTFEIIQLLAPDGVPVPVRPLFVDGYKPTILGTLGELALAQVAVTNTNEPVAWIRGQPPPFHPDIVLILNYVDTRTESAISDVFVFGSIFPANNVMAAIRWILRPRPAPPA